MKSKSIFTIVAVFIFAFAVSPQSDGSQQNKTGRAGTFAIRGAKIVTVSGPVIENGTIVIRDGKIAAVGSDVAIPKDAEVIDGSGLSVYPGMIDAGTNLGLVEIGQGANGTVDVSETGTNNANEMAIIGVNPNTSHVNVTRVNGITSVMSFANGGLIAGQATVINLNGSTQDAMALVPEFALVINFPRVSTFGGFVPGVGRQPVAMSEALKRRDDQIDELKKLFEQAENYGQRGGCFC